jgi:hypothetical protein
MGTIRDTVNRLPTAFAGVMKFLSAHRPAAHANQSYRRGAAQ